MIINDERSESYLSFNAGLCLNVCNIIISSIGVGSSKKK